MVNKDKEHPERAAILPVLVLITFLVIMVTDVLDNRYLNPEVVDGIPVLHYVDNAGTDYTIDGDKRLKDVVKSISYIEKVPIEFSQASGDKISDIACKYILQEYIIDHQIDYTKIELKVTDVSSRSESKVYDVYLDKVRTYKIEIWSDPFYYIVKNIKDESAAMGDTL